VRVRWTVPAANQLQQIFEYIAAGNPGAAARVVRRIRSAIHQTARMPKSGRIGRVAGTREVVVPGTSYLVAYRILEDMIHVLAIFHGAQDWPESF
jgi:toxin ParE1/3/4